MTPFYIYSQNPIFSYFKDFHNLILYLSPFLQFTTYSVAYLVAPAYSVPHTFSLHFPVGIESKQVGALKKLSFDAPSNPFIHIFILLNKYQLNND